jgi:hypothetical protein
MNQEEFLLQSESTHSRGNVGFSKESHHPGFWIVSYGQTLIEKRIINKRRWGKGGGGFS